MKRSKKQRFGRMLLASALVLGLMAADASTAAAFSPEEVHFLIPGGAGGGWDGVKVGSGQVNTL